MTQLKLGDQVVPPQFSIQLMRGGRPWYGLPEHYAFFETEQVQGYFMLAAAFEVPQDDPVRPPDAFVIRLVGKELITLPLDPPDGSLAPGTPLTIRYPMDLSFRSRPMLQ